VNLNPRQQQAVTAPLGPVLVVAGPGTGKTRVLTERIRHLITHHGERPDSILALTFTNRAASELTERLSDIQTAGHRDIQAATFHRFCLNVLRKHAEKAGLHPHFTLADPDLQRTVLYRSIPNLNAEESNLLNTLRHLESIKRKRRETDHTLSKGDRELYDAYAREMERGRLLDFDDLITRSIDLFREHPTILSEYQTQFSHILVDEFQDTDRSQYQLLHALTGQQRSLFIVTDSRQTIYAWRSADPENLARLRGDFPELSTPLVLEENYRSSRTILEAADTILTPSAEGHSQIRPTREGERLRVLSFTSHLNEARFLLGDIKALLKKGDLHASDIAVLYPQHAIGDEIERAFMEGSLPSSLAHQRGTFEQPVIRRCLSVLRYALDSENDAGLEDFLRKELDAFDHAIYPAIRAYQRNEGIRHFKRAVFDYIEDAPRETRRLVQRVVGLAGSAASALQHGSRLPFSSLVADLLDQLNVETEPSVRAELERVTDPFAIPQVNTLAQRLRPILDARGRIYITGDEVLAHLVARIFRRGLRGTVEVLVATRGDRIDLSEGTIALSVDPDPTGPVLSLTSRDMGPVLTAYKTVQSLITPPDRDLRDYVAFDVETTDLDLDRAEIIEMGAVRVRQGAIVGRFHTMVRPKGPVSQGAIDTHGITNDALTDAPAFREAGDRFLNFVGNDVLIAHNGYGFDFRVLNREFDRHGLARMPNARFDTLPMARSYYPEGPNSVDALAERFGIDIESGRHRAFDDARFLHQIIQGLLGERAARGRKGALESALDTVALALLFQPSHQDARWSSEEETLYNLGGMRLLSPSNTECVSLCRAFPRLSPEVLSSRIRTALREEPTASKLASQAPEQMQRLRNLSKTLERKAAATREAIEQLLDFAGLYRLESDRRPVNAVHLLTLHAAKGLEFRHVYICGLEEKTLPNARAVNTGNPSEMEEQRRLLYVGMTRAMDRLTLTSSAQRPRRSNLQTSRFLADIPLHLRER
jgi:DNA polymerase III epsilon subunit family exonuclease